MSKVFLDDINIETSGNLPEIGSDAPDFDLVTKEFKLITLEDFKNKNIILNIFPSIDTKICSMSVRHFNMEASKLKDTVVICASMDSPFACLNFCGDNGIDNVIVSSDIRNRSLGSNYGLTIIDSPLAGLLARAVVIIDKNQKVIYTELVNDINKEPNYEQAFAVFKNIS